MTKPTKSAATAQKSSKAGAPKSLQDKTVALAPAVAKPTAAEQPQPC